MGSPLAMDLAAAGIGRLGLVDFDKVEAACDEIRQAAGQRSFGGGESAGRRREWTELRIRRPELVKGFTPLGVAFDRERADFGGALADSATSLAIEGCVTSREAVAAEFLNALEPLWAELEEGPGVLEQAKNALEEARALKRSGTPITCEVARS